MAGTEWERRRVCLRCLSGIRFARQQGQHFEVRRPALARGAFAGQDFQAGVAREAAQILRLEAEVAVVEGLHGGAVGVARGAFGGVRSKVR